MSNTTSLQNSLSRLGSAIGVNQKNGVESRLKLDQLQPYRRQARTKFNEEDLIELAASLTKLGVLQPLIVRPLSDDKYEIVAGERRWRAARIAGLEYVPVVIRAQDDESIDQAHLAENLHRTNLDNMEMANRVQQDLEMEGATVDTVAAKYGKNRSWVSKMSSVARGGEIMHELINDGVTADRAVLSIVSSLERKNPDEARELVQVLKSDFSPNKRAVLDQHMKAKKAPEKQAAGKPGKNDAKAKVRRKEPTWREEVAESVELSADSFIGVAISPHSDYATEFAELTRTSGKPHLATKVRHTDASFALVIFGDDEETMRAYKAVELQLTSIK